MAERFWSVRVYGLEGIPYDPIVWRSTAGAARYAAYKAAREAGYFQGANGFARFLADVLVRPAKAMEVLHAPRIEP